MAEIIYSKKIKIGYYRATSVYLRIKIEQFNKEKETINHKHVKQYNVLSVVTENFYIGGQYNDFTDCDITVDKDKLNRIIELWNRWHLNDMNAGCIHQTAFDNNVKYDEWKKLQAEQAARCPEGYNYGSKWLLEPLPVEVETEIINLVENISKKEGEK